MVNPLVRRQIETSVSSLFPSSTSQSLSTGPTSSDTPTSSDISGPTPGSLSSRSRSSSSLEPTPALTTSPSVAPFAPTPNGQFTEVATASTTAATSSDASQMEGNAFLRNKPLSGFVLGLAGLAVLILVIIAVTCIVHRRSRKRLLIDTSNPPSDPKDIEDGTSPVEEKYLHPDSAGLP